jgi:hypothetical protein
MESLSKIQYRVDWNNVGSEITDMSLIVALASLMLLVGGIVLTSTYVILSSAIIGSPSIAYSKDLSSKANYNELATTSASHVTFNTLTSIEDYIYHLLWQENSPAGLTREEIASRLPSTYALTPRKVHAILTSLARRGYICGVKSSNLSSNKILWFSGLNYSKQFLISNHLIGTVGNLSRYEIQMPRKQYKNSKKSNKLNA